MIKKISFDDDFIKLADLLNEAFLSVTGQFGITKENCPTNTAYISHQKLKEQLIESREYYQLTIDNKPVGFVALEKSVNEPDTYYIEKLAVLPAFRHKGYGKQLMNYAEEQVMVKDGKVISIGLINENTLLKNWYSYLGYNQTTVKTFEHLPFQVCFMKKLLQ